MSSDWPLWEVFVRAKRGVSHVHAGTVHAPDAELAICPRLSHEGPSPDRAAVLASVIRDFAVRHSLT